MSNQLLEINRGDFLCIKSMVINRYSEDGQTFELNFKPQRGQEFIGLFMGAMKKQAMFDADASELVGSVGLIDASTLLNGLDEVIQKPVEEMTIDELKLIVSRAKSATKQFYE